MHLFVKENVTAIAVLLDIWLYGAIMKSSLALFILIVRNVVQRNIVLSIFYQTS